jgi:hypothetical protein
MNSAAGTVVFPAKRNLAVFQRYEALVGDGYAMGVAAEILDHLGRSAEGRLGVNHPFGLADWRQVCSEGGGFAQRFQIGEELEFTVGISFFESRQKEARNKRLSTRTGRKNPGRQAFHSPSGERPPPGTTQCFDIGDFKGHHLGDAQTGAGQAGGGLSSTGRWRNQFAAREVVHAQDQRDS